MNIADLIATGEGSTIEFKSSFGNKVIETVVAFANANGGKIIIGVNDHQDIVGITLATESIQNWVNQIKQNTTPSIIPDTFDISYDGKNLVVIDVNEFPVKPVSYKNRYFKRVENSNHIMSLEEISDEHLKTINSSWDYCPDPNHTVDDISIAKVKTFIKEIELKHNRSIEIDPENFLKKLDLIREKRITFGAYLLFANDYCALSGIQAGRFKSNTTIIDSISLNNDLFTQINDIMDFIRKHLMVEFVITGNLQREERFDYPEEVIREIVVNMIVHRDYRDSSDSIIKIFDDRIEFVNPGNLYGGLNLKQLLSDNYSSKTRNKLIASIFKEVEIIEKYGTGISRMLKVCKSSGIQAPQFEESPNSFKVVLFKKKINEGVNEGVKNMDDLYRFIRLFPGLRAPHISEKTKVPLKTIERWLKKLKSEEVVEYIGSPKKGGYFKK
jgi:ATP-dependent DNA helicase RecG